MTIYYHTLMIMIIAFSQVAFAESSLIKINSYITASDDEKSLVAVSRNIGTEPLLNLRVMIKGLDKQSLERPILSAGDINRVVFDISGIKRNAFSILTRFRDKSGRPYSSLGGYLLQREIPVEKSLKITSEPVSIDVFADVVFVVSNIGNGKKIEATLVLPDEFSVPESTKSLTISGNSKKELRFRVLNKYAFYGANYPFHCFFREPGIMEEEICRSMLVVEKKAHPVSRFRWYLLTLAGFFSLLLLYKLKKSYYG